MTTTMACWATNKDFDCAKVYFGYGSRHDTSSYNICLKALSAISLYDYDYCSDWYAILYKGKPDDRILADRFGLEFHEDQQSVVIPTDLVCKLPLKKQMELSPIHIEHPDGLETSLKWFQEVRKYCGYFFNNGYEEVEWYNDVFGERRFTKWNIPSLANIGKMNNIHREYYDNLSFRNEFNRKTYYKRSPYLASQESIDEMLDDWGAESKKQEIERFKIATECYKWL